MEWMLLKQKVADHWAFRFEVHSIMKLKSDTQHVYLKNKYCHNFGETSNFKNKQLELESEKPLLQRL